MKTAIIFAAAAAAIALSPPAHADGFDMNCGYVVPCGPSLPSPGPWNGQLQPTWEVPYGGWTTGPTLCDVFTNTCTGAVINPNGPLH